MKLTFYTANCLHNAQNTVYPNHVVATGESEMHRVTAKDHVCAKYKDNIRSNENFELSDNVPMDCDNDHSDEPRDWITPEALDEMLPDVEYVLIPSRHHMMPKDGKSARPRWHAYFAINPLTSAEAYAALKRKIHAAFPFFDSNALDAARFFFGSPGANIIWHEGNLTIADFITLNRNNDIIHQGSRNNTLSHFAGRVIKRFGVTDRAYAVFREKAAKCSPPLEEEELQKIWNSASKFGAKLAQQPGYIPPEEYDGELTFEPTDYSDVGQAVAFTAAYGDELVYTAAFDYCRYNGMYWEESRQKPVGAMIEFTDLQLAEATAKVEQSLSALEDSGISAAEAIRGGKRFEESLTPVQARLYGIYRHARSYQTFVEKRRDAKYIKNALDVSKPMLEKRPEDLDSNPYLLNTPTGTYDIRQGVGGFHEHDPQEYLTKITVVSPDDAGTQLWQDALNLFFCNDERLIEYVQLILGLTVIGKVFVEALIIAYGEGRNGKSTFWNAIARVLGSYSGSMSADALTVGCRRNVKPEMAELKGKRLIIAAELEEGMRLNTSIVKQLCSTDPVYAEKKFKDPFSFIPSHTLVLYTNHLPRVGATDPGTWRRLIVIPFHAVIEGDNDIKNYTDYLVENAGGAILKWIIEGAQKVIAQGYHIEAPQCVLDAVSAYRENNDWLGKFIEECCIAGDDLSEKSGELYTEYRNYCARTGDFTRSTTDFYAALELAGYKRLNVKNRRFIRGLQLKSNAELDFLE